MAHPPHVIFIVLDTQRRDRLSLYGHTRNTSPELDDFSTTATRFERAIAAAQWTIPSHASMFTGLYASTHELTEANRVLSGAHPTLPEILQSGGYHTVGFCNNPLVGVLNTGLQRGFDQFYNYAGAAPNRPLQTRRLGLPRPLTLRWQRFARSISNQFAHNDWLFRASLNPLITPIWTRTINYKGHTEHAISDVIAYTARHRAQTPQQPMFTFLNLMGTHLPYRPPQDALDRIAPGVRHDRHAYRFMGRFNADAARWASPSDPPLHDWERQVIDDFYDAEIAYQDAQLGRLLRYLRASGALDDTMVIITADHGEGHGDHDFFGHSFVVYQELVHVPLLIHYPARFPAGKRVTTNVSTRRLFHTVLDIAGVQPPLDAADPNADIHGLSLVRSLNCQPDTEGDVAFAEAFPPQTFLGVLRQRNPAAIEQLRLTQIRRGVYDGAHKLAVVANQVEGLFDVAHDPAETHNVAAALPDTVTALHAKLNAFVGRSTSPHAAHDGEVSAEVVENLRALGYLE
ncbi:MAG: sulfatase-like hydrolase/transferase [Armatimonadetes bacterium]|nr:sulfatase-like hydrolase/transferase [Anaerolineae bacterium]